MGSQHSGHGRIHSRGFLRDFGNIKGHGNEEGLSVMALLMIAQDDIISLFFYLALSSFISAQTRFESQFLSYSSFLIFQIKFSTTFCLLH